MQLRIPSPDLRGYHNCMCYECTHSFTDFKARTDALAVMCLPHPFYQDQEGTFHPCSSKNANMSIFWSRNQVPSIQTTQTTNASWKPFPFHLLDSHTLSLWSMCLLCGASYTPYPTEQWIPRGATRSASELQDCKSINNGNAHVLFLCWVKQKGPHKEVCVCELCLYMFTHWTVQKGTIMRYIFLFLPPVVFGKSLQSHVNLRI